MEYRKVSRRPRVGLGLKICAPRKVEESMKEGWGAFQVEEQHVQRHRGLGELGILKHP